MLSNNLYRFSLVVSVSVREVLFTSLLSVLFMKIQKIFYGFPLFHEELMQFIFKLLCASIWLCLSVLYIWTIYQRDLIQIDCPFPGNI